MTTIVPTSGGLRFDLANPRPADVSLLDIARHLSSINRFNGATWPRVNVACHSIRVARSVQSHGPRLFLLALLHDAHEAYVGDITTPVRHVIGSTAIEDLTRRIDAAIYAAVGIDPPTAAEQAVIESADRAALVEEWVWTLKNPPAAFCHGLGNGIEILDSLEAEAEFLKCFEAAAQRLGLR